MTWIRLILATDKIDLKTIEFLTLNQRIYPNTSCNIHTIWGKDHRNLECKHWLSVARIAHLLPPPPLPLPELPPPPDPPVSWERSQQLLHGRNLLEPLPPRHVSRETSLQTFPKEEILRHRYIPLGPSITPGRRIHLRGDNKFWREQRMDLDCIRHWVPVDRKDRHH